MRLRKQYFFFFLHSNLYLIARQRHSVYYMNCCRSNLYLNQHYMVQVFPSIFIGTMDSYISKEILNRSAASEILPSEREEINLLDEAKTNMSFQAMESTSLSASSPSKLKCLRYYGPPTAKSKKLSSVETSNTEEPMFPDETATPTESEMDTTSNMFLPRPISCTSVLSKSPPKLKGPSYYGPPTADAKYVGAGNSHKMGTFETLSDSISNTSTSAFTPSVNTVTEIIGDKSLYSKPESLILDDSAIIAVLDDKGAYLDRTKNFNTSQNWESFCKENLVPDIVDSAVTAVDVDRAGDADEKVCLIFFDRLLSEDESHDTCVLGLTGVEPFNIVANDVEVVTELTDEDICHGVLGELVDRICAAEEIVTIDSFEQEHDYFSKLGQISLDVFGSPSAKSGKRKRKYRKRPKKKGGSKFRAPNYFVAVQITNPEVHINLQKVQDGLKKNCPALEAAFVRLVTLHITLAVVHLADEKDIESAHKALDLCYGDIIENNLADTLTIGFTGLGNFKSEVLFAHIIKGENLDRLTSIVGKVSEHLQKQGIESADTHGEFKAHLTIAKLSKAPKLRHKGIKKIKPEFYKEFVDSSFGCQQVNSLQLLKMARAKDGSGYYECSKEWPFSRTEFPDNATAEMVGSSDIDKNCAADTPEDGKVHSDVIGEAFDECTIDVPGVNIRVDDMYSKSTHEPVKEGIAADVAEESTNVDKVNVCDSIEEHAFGVTNETACVDELIGISDTANFAENRGIDVEELEQASSDLTISEKGDGNEESTSKRHIAATDNNAVITSIPETEVYSEKK